MKVRILTDVSTVRQAYEADTVVDIPDSEGDLLIAAGLAEAAASEHPKRSSEPEAAILDDAPERATLPRARPRGI